jgi:hypothetical protein
MRCLPVQVRDDDENVVILGTITIKVTENGDVDNKK